MSPSAMQKKLSSTEAKEVRKESAEIVILKIKGAGLEQKMRWAATVCLVACCRERKRMDIQEDRKSCLAAY